MNADTKNQGTSTEGGTERSSRTPNMMETKARRDSAPCARPAAGGRPLTLGKAPTEDQSLCSMKTFISIKKRNKIIMYCGQPADAGVGKQCPSVRVVWFHLEEAGRLHGCFTAEAGSSRPFGD